ncbi:hypothetical protein ACFYPK_28300 [Streptomyces halstedii]|uniref:hypothetical protein n=1 Tax=Streptomyces halstedii TaxID=1944 RepID=UPI0034611016
MATWRDFEYQLNAPVDGKLPQAMRHGGGRARRVLAFAKLAEARALARMGDATGASTALSRAESWLDKITPGARDSPWLSYVTPGRLAADATEIFRDLRKPEAALGWSRQAGELSDVHQTRAVGLRLAVAATAACQARDLDQALDHGDRALALLPAGGVDPCPDLPRRCGHGP